MATVRPTIPAKEILRIRGPARVDRRTKNLTHRLRPGDIAVIDHADLDALAARALAEARVAAVVNARPFITGKYPNRGPAVLAAARVPLFTLESPDAFDKIRDTDLLVIDEGGCLYCNDRPLSLLIPWDAPMIAAATDAARANLGAELEKFARNTLEFLDADKDLLLDPPNLPSLGSVKIAGRHALIVVRGENYQEDLAMLRAYIEQVRPVLIAVDGGADALLAAGHKPDLILGDMDSVSDTALRCGAHLIVHAYARGEGRAPGMERVRALGLAAEPFPVPGTSEDAALLLAYEYGADLIVAVGTHSNLEDFLDKGRAGMASTFLVRLKIGPRLVDARGASKLYQPRPSFGMFLALVLSALFPIVVLVTRARLFRNMLELVRLWWRLHHH